MGILASRRQSAELVGAFRQVVSLDDILGADLVNKEAIVKQQLGTWRVRSMCFFFFFFFFLRAQCGNASSTQARKQTRHWFCCKIPGPVRCCDDVASMRVLCDAREIPTGSCCVHAGTAVALAMFCIVHFFRHAALCMRMHILYI